MQLLELLRTFFTIGLFSIGGGYAIIPHIQEQVVEGHGWIAQRTFTDIITISQMTPGPLAVNAATFVGIQISGLPGAIVATVGCVIAGICISLWLYRFFKKHRSSTVAPAVLRGLKASSLGLIASAATTLLLMALTGSGHIGGDMRLDVIACLIFLGALVAARRGRMNPMLVIAIAGVIGCFVY